MSKDTVYYTWHFSIRGYPWRTSCMLKNANVLRVHNLKNTFTYKTKEFNIYIVLIYNKFITTNKNAYAQNYLIFLQLLISMTMKQNFWFLHPTGIAYTALCTNSQSGCRNIMVEDNSVKLTEKECRTVIIIL